MHEDKCTKEGQEEAARGRGRQGEAGGAGTVYVKYKGFRAEPMLGGGGG